MVGSDRLRRLDDAVLDENARVRVGFIASAAGLVFALGLLVLAGVLAVVSLAYGYAPGVVVAALLLMASLGFGALAAAGLWRHRTRP